MNEKKIELFEGEILLIDLLKHLVKLNKKSGSYLQSKSYANNEQDVRYRLIAGVNQSLVGLNMMLIQAIRYAEVTSMAQFTVDTGLRIEQFSVANDAQSILFRRGFVSSVNFNIESSFRHIQKANGGNSRNYESILHDIVNNLQNVEPEKKEDIKKPLIICNKIRNTMHNDGFYNDNRAEEKDVNFEIVHKELGVKEFHFKYGEKCKCVSWEHLVVLSDVLIDSLFTILSDTTINCHSLIEYTFS